jgi:hypothetical protein
MLVPIIELASSETQPPAHIAAFALGHISGCAVQYFLPEYSWRFARFAKGQRKYFFIELAQRSDRSKFLPLLKGAEQDDKFFTLDANHTYISFRLYEDLHAVEFYGWHRSAAKQRLTSAVESALKPHLAKHELNKMEVLIEVLKSLAKAAKL